jgi:peptidoglycan hydrolase CwlO-like protein
MSLGGDHLIRNVFKTAIIKQTITALSLGAVLLSFSGGALADQYDDQIAAAQAAANAAAAQANQFKGQAQTYQAQVNQYQAQIDSAQAQINLSQAQYDQITNEIATNEANLANQKSILGADIKQMYLDSGVTPLEMLASSGNISDFMNKQQYQDKVQEKIVSTMASVVALQNQLASQKQQVTTLLASQQAQKDQLAALQEQADSLLATAQQNAAAANQQVQNANAQISQLQAAQAAAFAKLYSNGNTATSGSNGSFVYKNTVFGSQCGGGYPSSLCSAAPDSFADQWGLYNRECVSYAAWYMADVDGANVPNFGGHGNAYEWPSTLSGRFREDNDPTGAAVVMIIPPSMSGDSNGHAAVVQSSGGGWVHVSQYNWWPTASGPYGIYSTMDVKLVPGLIFIHFK